jgi:UDP-GlcNAc:undecaprenyl-phosphate GlcNAc-1-phosphate transferase
MPIVINLACRANIMDIPDDRKIHCDPVPRIGGVAMAIGAFIPIILWAPPDKFVKAILLGAGLLVVFGLIDDIKNIGFKLKFAGQTIAALVVIIYGGLQIKSLGILIPAGFPLPDWLSIPLTLVVIVAVTNAINLSDGLDGLAGGITLLTFLCIGYLSYLIKFQAIEVTSVAMVGAIFGLLRYNTHPATVFMGDAGSQLLGFVAITASLALTQNSNQLSPILPLLVIGFPVIDTVFVIAKRILKKRSPFNADKNHLHHKFIELGFYHSESVILIYILHAIMVSMAFVFRNESAWFHLCLYILFAALILAFIFSANRIGWQVKRYALIDKIIKGKLKSLREEQTIIRFSFKAVEIGFIFLLLFTCFLPEHIHIYFSISSLALLGFILLAWQIKKEWISIVIEISIFLMIPFLIYLSETDVGYLSNSTLIKAYSLSFAFLVFFVLLTLKFTRRRGFKTTPTDCLILIIAFVVPNLPDEKIRYWQMGFVATKIIVLFFTYEILKGELRLNTERLSAAGILALLVISIRGFIG